MPLYSYICDDCEKYFEVFVPLKKRNQSIKCPHCKKKLRKIISPVYFTFK